MLAWTIVVPERKRISLKVRSIILVAAKRRKLCRGSAENLITKEDNTIKDFKSNKIVGISGNWMPRVAGGTIDEEMGSRATALTKFWSAAADTSGWGDNGIKGAFPAAATAAAATGTCCAASWTKKIY